MEPVLRRACTGLGGLLPPCQWLPGSKQEAPGPQFALGSHRPGVGAFGENCTGSKGGVGREVKGYRSLTKRGEKTEMGELVCQGHQATVSPVRGRLTVSYFGDSRDLTPVGPHPPHEGVWDVREGRDPAEVQAPAGRVVCLRCPVGTT